MIARIGVPEGFQGMMFAISNVLIQSSINSFGTDVMAGNTAAINIEGFIFAALNALPVAAIAFTGQNMGAQNFKNINRIYAICSVLAVAASAVMCSVMVLGRVSWVSIFNSEPAVIETGALRLLIIGVGYILIIMTNITAGVMRGMGASLLPAVVCLLGICALRVVWVEAVFPAYRSYQTLLFSYPISWLITLSAIVVCLFIVKKRIIARQELSIAA
jgi:Na+-driven multidrug efflux pump